MESEGRSLAEKIIERYGTRDVFEIAEKAGVQVVYGSWTPVTAGEFDHGSRLITVNLEANIAAEKIVAHELGHHFLKEAGIAPDDEEAFCDEFAETLCDAL